MILSIIIPTYNEEEYLPVLLDSIKMQNFDDYEIIVADANSTDRTREIAEEYGCIVIDGGLPAVGRNKGAKAAKGEYLLFLDSDLMLTEDYLRDTIYEFQMERLFSDCPCKTIRKQITPGRSFCREFSCMSCKCMI